MVAARKGRVEIVRKLIQHGANVNLTNKVLTWILYPIVAIIALTLLSKLSIDNILLLYQPISRACGTTNMITVVVNPCAYK